jgi:hypothetical protein
MAAGFAVTVMVGFAQTDIATGTLQGVVEGFSGEPMAGVAVSTENAETGFSRAQITDPQGHFRIPLLPPGQYSLVAVGEGLASYEQRGLRLRVGEALFIRIRLGLPTVTDRLVVTEETDLVEITKASVTSTIDSMMIESLPSNGRDFRDLMFLAPQVGESAGRRGWRHRQCRHQERHECPARRCVPFLPGQRNDGNRCPWSQTG